MPREARDNESDIESMQPAAKPKVKELLDVFLSGDVPFGLSLMDQDGNLVVRHLEGNEHEVPAGSLLYSINDRDMRGMLAKNVMKVIEFAAHPMLPVKLVVGGGGVLLEGPPPFGMRLKGEPGKVFVSEVEEGSKAEAAGVLLNGRLAQINGVPLKCGAEEASQKILDAVYPDLPIKATFAILERN